MALYFAFFKLFIYNIYNIPAEGYIFDAAQTENISHCHV